MSYRNKDICPNMLLYRCVAHFMGRKAPGSSIDSVECVQKPLAEIYNSDSCLTKDIARDVHLLVFTNGIYAIPVNPIDPRIWIQMQNFRSCSAVKGVGQIYDPAHSCGLKFKSLDSPEAARSPLPAIFTVVAGRGNCVPLNDCYMFSCPDNVVAMTLVDKSRQAFEDKRGWSNNSKPPPVSMLDISDNFADEKWHCKTEEISEPVFREHINPELYQKPSLHGFYYAPQEDLIRTFDIGIEAEACPLPEVEIQPPCTEPCPRYLIINQQANENNDQPNPPPPVLQPDCTQTVPANNLPTQGFQVLDPYIEECWLPQYSGVIPDSQGVDFVSVAVPPPSYPTVDPSMVITQPYAFVPATGYYPQMFVDQQGLAYTYQGGGIPLVADQQ